MHPVQWGVEFGRAPQTNRDDNSPECAPLLLHDVNTAAAYIVESELGVKGLESRWKLLLRELEDGSHHKKLALEVKGQQGVAMPASVLVWPIFTGAAKHLGAVRLSQEVMHSLV